ncbi:MAG: sigma 54-interacting transcriptional regulator [Candidatus Marinimicrobia bacterium]|nr:sigma 54-interacting transcriptional regulator [Candidatus Neomarinimicrobiota bacterium]MCF7829459.1 sigma 54-interacting transcriptional regulator [Candidatus Neomarinimicrobiota bacterium]MCF7882338.1 sigma 54-interacting transcriptional regulator [Candidatus Neomarinimicrobiota bacterium]
MRKISVTRIQNIQERSFSFMADDYPPVPLNNWQEIVRYIMHGFHGRVGESACCLWVQEEVSGNVDYDILWKDKNRCDHHMPGINGNGHKRSGMAIAPVGWRKEPAGWIGWNAKPPEKSLRAFRRWYRSWYLRYKLASKSEEIGWEPVTIYGESVGVNKALEMADRISQMTVPVILVGETGTGKELIARALHLLSGRSENRFVAYNCGQLTDDNMALSTLFGHRKGSYTGATRSRKGLFRTADGGTLLLDELEVLSPRVQSMLLRVLENGEVYPVGQDTPERVDVRMIAATNRSPEELLTSGALRQDLYFRLKGSQIVLPPLRERGPEEIEHLTRAFLRQHSKGSDDIPVLDKSVWHLLREYHWPGNVRELHQVIQNIYSMYVDQGRVSNKEVRAQLLPYGSTPNHKKNMEERSIHDRLYHKMVEEGESFWEVVKEPYMARDLKRSEVQAVIARGIEEVKTYKKLIQQFNLSAKEYKQFLNFLYKNKLQPD